MSPTRVTALFALSAFAFSSSIALAQAVSSGPSAEAPTSNQGSAAEQQVPRCQATSGGSRMRRRNNADCELAETTTMRTEQELEVTLELPQQTAAQCEASALIEYSQRNTLARVEGTISIANCPARSAGDYTVAARVRDDAGEATVIEFNESWQLDTADDVPFSVDYPIGENVELVGVRVRSLTCTCAEAATVEAPAAEATR